MFHSHVLLVRNMNLIFFFFIIIYHFVNLLMFIVFMYVIVNFEFISNINMLKFVVLLHLYVNQLILSVTKSTVKSFFLVLTIFV